MSKSTACAAAGSHADDAHPFSACAGVVDTVSMFCSQCAAPWTEVVIVLHKFTTSHAWCSAGFFAAEIWKCHSA